MATEYETMLAKIMETDSDVVIEPNPNTGNPVIAIAKGVKEGIFQIDVVFGFHRKVRFITDSVEVLKAMSMRGFPLRELAQALDEENGSPFISQDEIIFDTAVFQRDNSSEIYIKPKVGRFVRLREKNTFEVSTLKR